MTLNASVVGVHIAEAAWIEDSVSHRTRDVSTPGAMATFAADIPFADGLCSDVVIHRVTAIAQRPRRTLEIVRRIERCPPIGGIRHEIAPPNLVGDILLRRLREIVVSDLGEISLFPAAAIDERNVVFRKRKQRIGFGKIGNEGVGVLPRIAHNVRHP